MDNYKSLFKPEQKIAAFDKIADMMFDRNFGSASKSEIELLMFSEYMEAMIEKYKIGDSTVINYDACSDYEIGKALGIPQEKVRTLKVKKQARYPRNFEWKNYLQAIKDSIVYDSQKGKIIIPIKDPNLYNEIRNFIEKNDGYIEITRGNNYIQIRPEYFFMLIYKSTDSEKDKEKIRKAFVKKLKEHNENTNIDDIKTDKELSELALSYGGDFFELAKSVAAGVSNPLVGVIQCIQTLTTVTKKMVK